MSTSFGKTGPGVVTRDSQPGIIARGVALLLLGLLTITLLGACSAARLAYNQAPTLTYWWVDGHVDLANGQSEPVRQDIDRFFAWHRSEALPAYIGLLQSWQAMATTDLDADQVCRQFQVIRGHIDTAAGRTVAPLARLALSLSTDQIDHQRRHQAKSNQGFEKDFMQGDEDQRLSKRLTRTIDRSERIYGRLSPEQRELVRTWLQRSPWDPARTLAERQRRQTDLLQTVQQAQANPAQAEALVAAHIRRIGQSPTPGYEAYSQSMIRHGCEQFAALHNSMSPQQREQALRTLKGYEEDLKALVGPA
ncbi:MAG: hypothetical protein EP308_01555 [Burkholderiales bacterium]|nr:MAG: hypothetical protein EP308_01555 [Burkholderiales bacterium]